MVRSRPTASTVDRASALHDERRRLRHSLRSSRRALRPAQQHHAAQRLAQQLVRLPHLREWRHVAMYWPCDGEIDPSIFARYLQSCGVTLYLPRLAARPGNYRLRFVAAAKTTYGQRHRRALRQQPWPARRNRFGQREPLTRGFIRPERLDAILLPLVGFDACGQRLGMGGGFYDRLIATLRGRVRRPKLVGLAHQQQQVATLPLAAWDEPVDQVITDAGRLHHWRAR